MINEDPADPIPFLLDLARGQSPSELLARLVAGLHRSRDLDAGLCTRVGVGNLEALLRSHEVELWPEVVLLARTDERFRVALKAVWAHDSPYADRREALLRDLDALDQVR